MRHSSGRINFIICRRPSYDRQADNYASILSAAPVPRSARETTDMTLQSFSNATMPVFRNSLRSVATRRRKSSISSAATRRPTCKKRPRSKTIFSDSNTFLADALIPKVMKTPQPSKGLTSRISAGVSEKRPSRRLCQARPRAASPRRVQQGARMNAHRLPRASRST
jgi:hypothetical protein